MAQGEMPAGYRWVVRRIAPGGDHAGLGGRRQPGEQAAVGRQIEERRSGSVAKHRSKRGGVRRRCPDGVAGVSEQAQDRGQTGETVEPDGVRDLSADAGIVRQHHCDPPIPARRRGQPRPPGGSVGGERDAGRVRAVHAARELQRGLRFGRGFERDRGGQQPPVEFGQHHLHGQIRLRQAAKSGAPALDPADRKHQLQHRGTGSIERRAAFVATGGKSGGVEHDRRAPGAQQRLGETGASRVFQAADIHRADRQATRGQRVGQRIDVSEIARQQMRAVEHDHRQRSVVVLEGQGIQAGAWHRRGGRAVVGTQTGQMLAQRQRALGVLRPALAQERFQPGALRRLDGGEFGQARIVPDIARHDCPRYDCPRHDCQPDAPRPAGGGDFLGPIAPVVEAAEQADHHAFRARNDLVDIQIDRHRMAQPRQAGQTQAGPWFRHCLPGGGQRPQIAVGKRQEHQIGRRLAEILGCLLLVERLGFADQEMQGVRPSRLAGWRPRCRPGPCRSGR